MPAPIRLDDLPLPTRPRAGRELGGGLRPLLEPIVDLRTGDAVAHELLVRPRSGISLMELHRRTGDWLLPEVTGSVLELAGSLLGRRQHPLHVNITGLDLDRPTFADDVLRAVPGSRLGSLVLEVTEQFPLVESAATLANVDRLRRVGVAFAIDDFGQGWSNLRSLVVLRPQVVKVTREVVEGDLTDGLARWVVRTARRVGATTVLEQIERPGQDAWAAAVGFDAGQGWLWTDRVPVG